MSYSLIYNCEFTQPVISTDSYVYSTDFTTDQQNFFYWSFGPYSAIQNGNTAFSFSDPILINKIQFCSIQYTNFIHQSFTVILEGSYRLYFYYAVRTSYFFNNLQIY